MHGVRLPHASASGCRGSLFNEFSLALFVGSRLRERRIMALDLQHRALDARTCGCLWDSRIGVEGFVVQLRHSVLVGL